MTEGNLTFFHSILEVCSVRLSDGGEYRCIVESNMTSDREVTKFAVMNNTGGFILMTAICLV